MFYKEVALSEMAFMAEVPQSEAAQCHPSCPRSLASLAMLEETWRNENEGDSGQDDHADTAPMGAPTFVPGTPCGHFDVILEASQ